MARLFDLRGKLDKLELEDAVRSVGVKRVAAGKTGDTNLQVSGD